MKSLKKNYIAKKIFNGDFNLELQNVLNKYEIKTMNYRYSKVNNNYLKSYDPKKESKHIIYLDTNNLYGYAMSKFLPKSGFK